MGRPVPCNAMKIVSKRRRIQRRRTCATFVLAASFMSATTALSSNPRHRHSRRDVVKSISAGVPIAVAAAAHVAVSVDPAHAAAAGGSKSVAEIYDAASDRYDSLYSGSRTAAALDFDGIRRANLSRASGRVLELGVGTGLNLPHYPPPSEAGAGAKLESITAVDVSGGMLSRARDRLGSLPNLDGVRVDFRVADAAALDFPNESFDAVADTFSLCVFERPSVVLAEAYRVLRPGGLLLITETDATPTSRLLGWTNALLTNDVARTCRADDDVLKLVVGAGFDIVETEIVGGGVFRRVVGRRPR